MEIREPTPADAEALGRAHRTVWREAYRGLIPAEILDAPVTRFVQQWVRALTGPDDGATTRIAVQDGAVVGFATGGPTRDVDGAARARDRELWMLNVLASHHGCGLAGRLLGEVIGDDPAELWVFEANRRARAFYTKHGFTPDGARRSHPHFGDAPEIRLVR